MAELSHEDVQQILELIDKSHFDFFELQLGELKLTVSKTGLGREAQNSLPATPAQASLPAAPAPPAAGEPGGAAPPPETAASTSAPAVQQTQAGPAQPATGEHRPAADTSRVDGLVTVNAPMVGTFYAQPEPGAPPYVQVGSTVEPDTTMGLIEVMKVFTPVAAGVHGVVAEVLVQNAQFVEFGQALFMVKPDAAGDGERG